VYPQKKARVSYAAGIERFKAQFMKDDLDKLLKTWNADVAERVDFKPQVWKRIGRGSSAEGWLQLFLEWLIRPQIASIAAALSVLAGAWIGSATAARGGQTAYLHAVDPYAQVSLK
jgi:hypothetical protein